jgi:ABC-type amino acid transport substrate-binding protein
MAFHHRYPFLVLTFTVCLYWQLAGCGLALRGLERLLPEKDVGDVVCARDRLFVGLTAGPIPPFVFPIVGTSQGPRVTGFDVELVEEIEQELAARCGKPVKASLRLVPFLDLFTLVHENKLDLFLSAMPADVAGTGRGGFAYSLPYFIGGGLVPVARNARIAEEIGRRFETMARSRHDPLARRDALKGFRKAVVDGSSAAAYAEAHFANESFVVCDSHLSAFEAGRTIGEDPDLILGSQPVMEFMVGRMKPEWTLVTAANGGPLLLTHEYLSIVLGDEKLSLRWFINNLLFRLDDSGTLDRIRKRWMDDAYDYRARAETEGLPVEERAEDIQQRRHCYVGESGFGKLRTLTRE